MPIERQEYLQHRYKDNVQKFMDAAAFYGSHIGRGLIYVSSSDGCQPLSDVPQIYNSVLNKFCTKHKTYLYIRENYGLSYSYHDAADNKRKLYFGKTLSGQSEPDSEQNELYTTSGWNIYIRDISTDGNSPVKFDCIVKSHIDSGIEVRYRTVSIDVVSTNTDNTYPAVYSNMATGESALPPITVTLYPYYPSIGCYFLCATFVMINGILRVSAETQSANLDYNYNCIWRADVKNTIESSTAQIKIISSHQSGMPDAPTMLQRTVFEKHGSVGMRLYTSVKLNTSEPNGNSISPIESCIFKLTNGFTKEDYFQAIFGTADFNIYKGEITETDSTSSLDSLCIVNTKNMTERNKWYLLGITEDEYNRYVGALNDIADCSNIYFTLNEVLDEQTIKSFYHKYELVVRYDAPDKQNKILSLPTILR